MSDVRDDLALVRDALETLPLASGDEPFAALARVEAELARLGDRGDLARWDHAAWLQQRLGEARQQIADQEVELARLEGFCERYDHWMLEAAKALGWDKDDWDGRDPAHVLMDRVARLQNGLRHIADYGHEMDGYELPPKQARKIARALLAGATQEQQA